MRCIEKLLGWLACAALLVLSSNALAVTCTTSTGSPSSHYLTPQSTNIKINPGAADGTVLASLSQTLYPYTTIKLTCEELKTVEAKWEMTTGAYLGNNIYESGMDGIGIRAYSYADRPFDTYMDKLTLPLDSPPWITVKLQLVKIGPITGKGSLTGTFGRVVIPDAGNFVWMTMRFTSTVTMDSGTPTCSVSTPVVPVTMPKAQAHMFTGLGSVSDAQSFNLGVKCVGGSAGTSVGVYAVLTDQSTPDNVSNALSLSSDSTASGVGVQILHGSNILGFGPDRKGQDVENRWFAGTARAGDFTIPLSARYVQVGSPVTAGSANARATFTLSYE